MFDTYFSSPLVSDSEKELLTANSFHFCKLQTLPSFEY